VRFFYPCPEYHHCPGVPLQAAVHLPTVQVPTARTFISVTRVWSAINKHNVTAQRIVPDVAGLQCASVCLSVCPTQKKYRLQAHISPTHMLHARLIKRTYNFRFKTGRSSNKFSEQPSPLCKTELQPVSCPQRTANCVSAVPAVANMRENAFVSVMQTGIGTYEWTREERSELERKSQFCAWCVDTAANRSVYISVDARICRSADDEEEITRKEDLHDLLTHILRTHSTAL
jgi:hypothetical protein